MDSLSFKDLQVIDDKNSFVLKNKNNYLKNSMTITVTEKLAIGDIVKLKGKDYDVEIAYVDYEIPGLKVLVDYAGKREDLAEGELVLFNQKDIEEVRNITKTSDSSKVRR